MGSPQRGVLVTGGAGYIGSTFAAHLVEHGVPTVVLDDLSAGHRDAVPAGAVFYHGAIEDAALVQEIVARHDIDACVHFASLIDVAASMGDPLEYFYRNTASSLRLLYALCGAGVLRFVFSSTAAVYGAPEVVPIPESHPLRPLSPYGRSKLMMEQCLADTSRATPLRYLAFRYFNAAGATPGRPERHNPETHLIPNVMRAARGEGGPLRVYGSDFDTHDGTAVRDYVHVADLAEAHRLGLEYLRAGGPSETLNLGTGTGHSVLDVVRAVERVTGRAVPVQPAPRRQGDPSRLVALADRAAAVLGWRPQVTALEDIVRSVDRYG